MGWILGNADGTLYVKRTCTRYGPFYGTLVVTGKRSEARVWSRRHDVSQFAATILTRNRIYAKTNFNEREKDFLGGRERIQIESEDGRTGFGIGD